MKILKIPKLPKLKNVKYKCSDCGLIFIVNDKDVMEMRTPCDAIVNPFVECPGCENSMIVNDKQFSRVLKYKYILRAQRKWYGPQEDNNDEN